MKRKILPMLALAAAVVLAVPMRAATSCHVIQAKGVGRDDGTGKTTADVIGGGLLQGRLVGVVTPTSPPVDGVATFTEVVTFTTANGTLTVEIAGGINIQTGAFAASGTVKDATGKLAGATGNLAISGTVDFATGLFSEEIQGVICVDLAP